jgi:hypothetical protein
MSEPYLPLPAPEPDPYWDPSPARCPYCRTILRNLHPASRLDGRMEGICGEHGLVPARYLDSPDSEK